MFASMSLQVTLIAEWFTTNTTGKWLLPTMYALMCLQMSLLPK
jgi:hypothetical protein